jgi:hypothetical protein
MTDDIHDAPADDPIVEEVRRAGQAYIDSFGGDWKALMEDLRRHAEKRGARTVSFPPRQPVAQPTPATGR